MRNAYALLGFAFLVVFGGAYVIFDRAHAPTEEAPLADSVTDNTTMALTLTSPAFEQDGLIPSQYTCDGANSIPPLAIDGVPEAASSLVIVMDDPDIPEEVKAANNIEKFDHFARYNIPAQTAVLIDGSLPGESGLNSRGEEGYTGPCPPPQYEPKEHRYVFRLYALPEMLSFEQAPTLDELEAAAKAQAIAQAELIGRYARE